MYDLLSEKYEEMKVYVKDTEKQRDQVKHKLYYVNMHLIQWSWTQSLQYNSENVQILVHIGVVRFWITGEILQWTTSKIPEAQECGASHEKGGDSISLEHVTIILCVNIFRMKAITSRW